jgi:formate-dependent nitrite reductase cytochrome c552 subunit
MRHLWIIQLVAFGALQMTTVFGLEPLPQNIDTAFQLGVHSVVGCESCHWEEPDKTPRASIPGLCGDCHPGAQEDYVSSVHSGNGALHAVCTDCHGIHGILPVADPGSKAHRSLVCGQCHPGPMEELRKGPHSAAFEKTQALVCASCHSNHAVIHPTIAIVEPACLSCHASDTDAFALGQRVDQQFTALRSQQAEGALAIGLAETDGFETRQAAQLLKTSSGQLTQARLAWHSLDENRILEEIEKASKTASLSSARIQESIDTQKDREFRVMMMWIFILVAVVGLHLKRKSLEA